ncbi:MULTISPECIES: hypothetical protein [unclassified Vibrio]|uniref:Porin n=1 Tax=Vibrio sp. HB236076 TaxID=3232307 RepID=A0AB39HCG8_9VIBR|nr:hypothetical protein [Vibrio sp. HB161653]MDP5253847.1 hypothetical protein [Vibrio sp. HB161653]
MFWALLLPSISQANHAWDINGFGSLAVTHTGNETLAVPNYLAQQKKSSNNTYWGESLLGVQVDYHFNHRWKVSSQLIGQTYFEHDIDSYLQRLFVQYNDDQFTARLGRIGLETYLLSDYRNVGFAYLWAHPSMEFYGPFSMDYYDGFELGYTFPFDFNQLNFRLYGGTTKQIIHRNGEVYELKNEPMFGAKLQYDTEAWLYRLSAAYTEFTDDLSNLVELRNALNSITPLWPEASTYADSLLLKDTSIHYYSTGFRYEGTPWLWQTELSYTVFETDLLGDFWAGYTSLGYQFDEWTLFSSLGFVEPTERIRSVDGAPAFLSELQEIADTAFKTSANQHSFSLGFRWDFYPNFALKAQWDRTWIKQYGGVLWVSDEINSNDEIINTFSLKLDFIF